MSRKIWKDTLKEAKKHVKDANVLENDLFEARVTVTAEIHMRVLGGRITDRFMHRCEIIGSEFVALEFDK